MNKISKYFGLAAASLLSVAGFSACQDHFDNPEVLVPVADIKPNTTIEELKTLFWNDSTNYCHQIGVKENGDHYIIAGRVTSSDYDGNIFKTLYIQDETAPLSMSINQYNLYLDHRIGQELVMDLTGMYIGKYNGMMQLGAPSWFERDQCITTSFMAPELFNRHTQLNGLPDLSKVDTVLVADFSQLGSSKEELIKWQGQLVRFNNAKFANAGNGTLVDEYHSSGYNQSLNVKGGSIDVRTSGYAKFWNMPVPAGNCDVVGMLGYFNGWQLVLNDAAGIMEATVNGDREHPYTVAEGIEFAQAGTGMSGWVSGYIVGAVAPEVTEVKSNSDIQWTAPFVLANTLVIADSADCRDYTECLILELPEGSLLQSAGNLADNEGNLGKKMGISGRFVSDVYTTYGVTGYDGRASEFFIEGVDLPEEPSDGIADGDGSKESPYSPAQVMALGNPGTTAWVKGYIVGSAADKTADSFTTATGASASGTNIFIAATADETDYNKCLPVQLPVGDVRAALNLQANPGNLGKEVVVYGSLEAYFGLPGIKSVSQYKIDGQGGDTPVEPVDPVSSLNATFEGVTAISQLPGWSLKNVIGNKSWYFTSFEENSYAAITGYKGTSTDGYESWLITPPLNFDAMAKKVLSFQSQAAYTGTDKLEVFVMTTADPSTATLSALECHIAEPPATGYSGFEASGEISLESFSGVGYIGFRYTAPAGASGYRTYCIDNVVAGQDGQGGETPDPDEPDTPVAGGAGSEESPYTVADVVALNNPADKPVAWVEGYIVGSAPGKAASSFVTETGAGASATNLFIADSADQTDYNKCLPVQLPAGAVRDALNLQANPDNLGKKVKLSGTLEKYFGLPGLKSVSQYTVL